MQNGNLIVTPPPVSVPADQLTFTIGIKDLYDTSVSTAAAVRELTDGMRDFRTDLEHRVRSLERWRYASAGAVALACTAIGFMFNFMGK